LEEIGAVAEMPEYAVLVEANERLQRALEGKAPGSLKERAQSQLQKQVGAFFDALLTPRDLRFGDNIAFSGKSVLAPGAEFRYDQVGIPSRARCRQGHPHPSVGVLADQR